MEANSRNMAAEFYCTGCGQLLNGAARQEQTCVSCGTSNAAPEPRRSTGSKDVRPETGEEVKFHCQSCDQKLSSPTQFAGREFDCPNCTAPNVVPGERSASDQPAEALLKFFCNGCGQKLSVEKELAGRPIDCPICRAAITVPSSSQPGPVENRKKTASVADLIPNKEEQLLLIDDDPDERNTHARIVREAKEKAKREAKEKAKRKANEKAEREAKEKAEREAKEKAEREAKKKAEREAKEKAEREAKEKAEREAKEKAEREAKEEVQPGARSFKNLFGLFKGTEDSSERTGSAPAVSQSKQDAQRAPTEHATPSRSKREKKRFPSLKEVRQTNSSAETNSEPKKPQRSKAGSSGTRPKNIPAPHPSKRNTTLPPIKPKKEIPIGRSQRPESSAPQGESVDAGQNLDETTSPSKEKDLSDTQPIRLTHPVSGSDRTILPRPKTEDREKPRGAEDRHQPIRLESAGNHALPPPKSRELSPTAKRVSQYLSAASEDEDPFETLLDEDFEVERLFPVADEPGSGSDQK